MTNVVDNVLPIAAFDPVLKISQTNSLPLAVSCVRYRTDSIGIEPQSSPNVCGFAMAEGLGDLANRPLGKSARHAAY